MKIPPLSHSFLAKWDQCPRQAHHVYVLKDIPKEDSEALRWGNQVHKAMEKRVQWGATLPEAMQHWEPLAAQLDGRGAKAELMLGMKLDGMPCGFFDTGVELRGKVDVLVAYNNFAVIFDWKTGKRKEDPEELEIHAVLLKAHKPHLEHISGRYVWLKDNAVGQRHELTGVKAKLFELQNRAAQIQQAFDNEWFPPQQSPLCGWCPVKQCEFHPGEKMKHLLLLATLVVVPASAQELTVNADNPTEFTFMEVHVIDHGETKNEKFFLGPLPEEGQAVEMVYVGKEKDGSMRFQLRTKQEVGK